MRTFTLLFFLLAATLFTAGTTSSCSRKTGCPAYEEAHVKPNKKGKLSTKRGSSNLFPKKMRKKSGG